MKSEEIYQKIMNWWECFEEDFYDYYLGNYRDENSELKKFFDPNEWCQYLIKNGYQFGHEVVKVLKSEGRLSPDNGFEIKPAYYNEEEVLNKDGEIDYNQVIKNFEFNVMEFAKFIEQSPKHLKTFKIFLNEYSCN